MKNLTRRSFLKTSALAAAAFSTRRVLGANEDIRVAVVGFNGRGAGDMAGLMAVKGVRIAALCDVDKNVLAKGVKNFADKGEKVESYTDIRKLLESKNVDAVCIATPNHWHSLAAIWAMQAGKDVYLEKPVSHNIWEGRQVIAAARKHGRIVQTGSQARSSPAIQEAIAWLRAGNLGTIIRARGFCYKPRPSLGKTTTPMPIPPSVDYDLWCGPAPKEQLMRQKLHYDWHWVWPTGNGDIGNQGVHQVDVGRWTLGESGIPPQVFSVAGRLGYEDDGQTANTQVVCFNYAPAPLIFEVRGLPSRTGAGEMDKYHGVDIGNIVECDGGSLVIPATDYSSAIALDKDGKEIKKFQGKGDHYENFIKAVRSRKPADLNGEVREGHVSAALAHCANISYRLGQKHSPDEIRAAVKNKNDLAEAVERMTGHLTANKVDLEKTPATLGAVLKLDVKAESFIGNAAANQLRTREYRKPFVVPEKV